MSLLTTLKEGGVGQTEKGGIQSGMFKRGLKTFWTFRFFPEMGCGRYEQELQQRMQKVEK